MGELSKAELRRKLESKIGLETERHILLCTGPNCQPDIATHSERFLHKRLRELGAATRCHVTAVGCLKLCRSGPIALVYPEGTYYCGVTPDACERIIDEHLLRGEPVESYHSRRLRWHPFCKSPRRRRVLWQTKHSRRAIKSSGIRRVAIRAAK